MMSWRKKDFGTIKRQSRVHVSDLVVVLDGAHVVGVARNGQSRWTTSL